MWCTPHAHASCWDLQLYDTAPPTSLWRVLRVHLNHRALYALWCLLCGTAHVGTYVYLCDLYLSVCLSSMHVGHMYMHMHMCMYPQCVMRDGEFLFATACRMSIQSFSDLPLWLFMIII